MATSQVKKMYAANGKCVVILGRHQRIQRSQVFENNPKIVGHAFGDSQPLVNGPGLRPYIAAKTSTHWQWQHWDISPGEIFLTDDEKLFSSQFWGAVLIEPNTKVQDGNKTWPWARWQALVDRVDVPFVQIGPPGTKVLRGVKFLETSFREGLAALSGCKGFVGTEGAMHHAAAALGVPAVVLWSEYISPEITGYTTQVNLRHAGGWCGSRLRCEGCKRSMEAIGVDEAESALTDVLSGADAVRI